MTGTDIVPTDLKALTALVCQGRTVDADGELVGDVCGARYDRPGYGSLLERARAAGWRVGHRTDGTPDAMCPRCSKPIGLKGLSE